jgi:hypothetical protein
MSKTDIQSWIAAANDYDDDHDDSGTDTPETYSRENEDATNWGALMAIARRSLLTSQTKVRVHFLNERLLPLASKGGEQFV